MSKFLLSAIALAAILVPLANAQIPGAVPGPTLGVQIQDLPASAVSNGTQIAQPFNVTVSIANAPACLASGSAGATFSVAFDAKLVNSTGASTTAQVVPKVHTFAGPVLVPAPGGSPSYDSGATLLVNAGPYSGDALNATIELTATFTADNGNCSGVGDSAPASDKATYKANFEPVPDEFGSTPGGQKMPGLGLGLTLVGLALVAFVARRN